MLTVALHVHSQANFKMNMPFFKNVLVAFLFVHFDKFPLHFIAGMLRDIY